jgi:hypothetical protein
MAIKVACSTKSDIDAACSEIGGQLQADSPRVVLYFASSAFDPPSLAAGMARRFPGAALLGCTTAGEIISGRMLKNSVVAMSLPGSVVENVSVQVVADIGSETRVPEAFTAMENQLGVQMRDLDVEKYVGIILVDGMSGAEERLMEKIGDLTDVTFIGASAGDDRKFKQTWVFAGGEARSDAAVLALLELRSGYDVIKTQSFCETGNRLTATRVDEGARTVLEFDGKPAAEAYAEALGIDPGEAPDHFMHAPVGLMVEGEPYVRSPQQLEGKSICFYCNIKQGMELSLLESTDIPGDTRNAVNAKLEQLGSIAGLVNFHCILRTLELEQKEQTGEYGKIFTDIPTVGFSTYGEEYIGHINQTSTMLVFK